MPTQQQIFLHKFRNSWKILLAVILIVPFLKWFFLVPLDLHVYTFPAVMYGLGKVSGIIGTLLFSVSMILSYRNKVFEVVFGGLDKLYRIHHLTGMYGFFILLLHPIFLAVPKLLFSVEEAMSLFIPFETSLAVDFGILSIIVFMLLIGVTLFGVIFSYQLLKKFHMFLGVAFLFGAIHGFLISSDITNDIFLRVWVLGFALLGIISYILHTVFGAFTKRKSLYSVSSVHQIEGGISQIQLSPVSAAITHLPGQFGFFSFVNSKIVSAESHPFTISSWANDGTITISVKALGDFTKLLPGEVSGSLVEVEGPYGEFVYGYGDIRQVWAAGGVGVTPFVSFAEHMLTQETCPYDVDFFYSVRTKDDIAFHSLFTKLSEKFPSFRYHPMPSDTDGFITGEMVVEKVSGVIMRDIFVCGPPPMMKALSESLISLGIRKERIHSELFSLLK